MWLSTLRPGSSSSEPIGMIATPRSGSHRGAPEPHARQKAWAKNLAPGSRQVTTRSSPRTKPSPSTDVNPFVVWAAARARRQREQWQLWTRMKGSVTS